MARTKQVPIRRESSSEFFNKQTATWEDNSNGKSAKSVSNGAPKASATTVKTSEAGVLQLVISVVGIYASL